jgi:putative RNA 2'-phosphotransferase
MNNRSRTTDLSKWLSYVLRHKPDSANISLDTAGWIGVDELLAAAQRTGHDMTRTTLEEIVATSDKQRFAFNEDRTRIRANQGHTVKVDLQLPVLAPPPVLYHGTPLRFLDSIVRDGLRPQQRHHVHLSTDPVTALRVGNRQGKAVLLRIDAQGMYDDGHVFYRSENGVWLSDHVPPPYLKRED